MNNDRLTSHSWPKISVVTPSYNQGKYIEETIASVLGQNYPNLEYIIIDGGSTDETLSVIDIYSSQIYYFVSEADNGQSHAINKGFAKATGDILCWLNSDDQFAPDALWSVALAFQKSQADIVAGICEVYENNNLVHRHFTSCQDGQLPLAEMLDLENGWNAGQFFYQPEVFFSRELWERSGAHVNEACFYSMDYELWCRFALNNATLVGIGAPLVYFRSHEEQKTAAESEFKKELVKVRDQFVNEHNIDWQDSKRPTVNWARKLKVALVNDIGYRYGAGTAQLRIAGAFDLAGQEVSVFNLLAYNDRPKYIELQQQIKAFSPDIVIFGNLHAVEPENIDFLVAIEQQYSTFWLTHDFWLFTGRCPYTSGCEKLNTGCDASCPTKESYPVIGEHQISFSWQNKRQFLTNATQFSLLANSSWSAEVSRNSLPNTSQVAVQNIRLGVPIDIFKVKDKHECKAALSIANNSVAIAFSVSSLSDERKGGSLLINALQELTDIDLTLILIGRLDKTVALDNVNIVELGYIEDNGQLVTALNAADIYVGPSSEETFGQVFIEAALCGVPSIGFDATGVKDAIEHGVTGIKVKNRSAHSLASSIRELAINSELREQISFTAPIYARAFYSLEGSYRSFFNVLDKQGLLDKFGVAHKISLAKFSSLVINESQGWADLTFKQKINVLLRRFVDKAIGVLPSNLTSIVRQALPKSLERMIMSWLIGR